VQSRPAVLIMTRGQQGPRPTLQTIAFSAVKKKVGTKRPMSSNSG
jgi:hypothetical protein